MEKARIWEGERKEETEFKGTFPPLPIPVKITFSLIATHLVLKVFDQNPVWVEGDGKRERKGDRKYGEERRT